MSDRSVALPARVIVSLRAGAVLAVANVACVIIFSWAWTKVRTEPKTIQVTGSARKAIVSDLIDWTAKLSAVDPDLTKAYEALKTSSEKALAYLKAQGIPDSQIKVSSIGTFKRRGRDEKGNETEKIVAYELWQHVEVTSADVMRVSEAARKITGLIKDGVIVESNAP